LVNRGEVWWGEDPKAGRRPYLVLTRDRAIAVRRRVVVAPATRTIRDLPSEVVLDEHDGMPDHCVLSLDNVLTVPKHRLVERICTLGPERLNEVCEALSAAVDC
jgi:mRNA interferase MazF